MSHEFILLSNEFFSYMIVKIIIFMQLDGTTVGGALNTFVHRISASVSTVQ
jgi:hypothetical protein